MTTNLGFRDETLNAGQFLDMVRESPVTFRVDQVVQVVEYENTFHGLIGFASASRI